MNLSLRIASPSAYLFGAIVVLTSPLFSQDAKCKRFFIEDTRLPTYPPIARAAHMEATLRFKVLVPPTGTPQISFMEGPNQGVWQILVTNARDYLTARTYGWLEGSHTEACVYVATVEYRIIPGEVTAPNNFTRVTVFDETHTLVEVKPTTPTVNY